MSSHKLKRRRRPLVIMMSTLIAVIATTFTYTTNASAEDEITIPYGSVELVCGIATVNVEAHYSPIDESTAEFVVEFVPDEGDPVTLDTVTLPRDGDNPNDFTKSYIIGVDLPEETAGIVRLNVDGAELNTSDNLSTCEGDVNEPPVEDPDPVVDPPVVEDGHTGVENTPQPTGGSLPNTGA